VSMIMVRAAMRQPTSSPARSHYDAENASSCVFQHIAMTRL